MERYSFTKLSSFWQCKYGYELTYIKHKKGIGNCFSSYGVLVHSILERYARGELKLWSLPSVYEFEFDAIVKEPFPKNKYVDLKSSYYKQGLDYLKWFSGYDNYKILDVESSFSIQIKDWEFNGVIDLVYEDDNGRLILQDHKSKSSFKNKQEKAEYARQLYLYSLFIKQKYGKFPDILRFNTFRKKCYIDIPFNLDDCKEAYGWANDTVALIRACWAFTPNRDEFFCSTLCNHREYCNFKKK